MYVSRGKIAVPELPRQFVSRPRLLAALDAVPAGAVTLLCAPPGYGKTMLLADWARANHRLDTAWVSLDADDSDPARLWDAVLAALLGCASTPAADRLRRLAAVHPDGRPDAVAAIVDALDALPGRLRLVLDNVDELYAEPALRGVEKLIRNHPRGIRLVLASRLDPPLALHRLRLEDRLVELRAADLRFSLDEAQGLLESSGVRLSRAQTVALQASTEGWVAGLRLATVSLGTTEDPDRFLATFATDDRAVADYLVDEVLSGFSPDTRELLSVLSVCQPLPPALATELTGRRDAAQRLEWLEQETALIVAGPHRDEYRIQALLGSYLRAELTRRRPSLVAGLHATAARWWAACERPVEALGHARLAGDAEELSAVLRRVAVPLVLAGEHALLRRALTDLDPNPVAQDRWLAAIRALTDEPPGTADHPGRVADTWALPGRPELDALATLAELAHPAAAPPGAIAAQPDPAAEALARFAAGTAELGPKGDPVAAHRELDAALRVASSHGYRYLAMQCEALLAQVAGAQGDQAEMVAASLRATATAATNGWSRSTWAGYAQALLAWAALLRAEPDEAASLAARAIGVSGEQIDPDLRFGLRVVLGAATADSGNGLDGLQRMQRARAELGDRPLAPVQAAAPAVLEYRVALRLGYPAAAGTVLSWLADRAGVIPEGELMRAWAEAAAGNRAAARARLRPLLDGRLPPLLPNTGIEAWVLTTQLALAAGDRPAARRALQSALTEAQHVDVLRPFIQADPIVRELLVHHLGSFGPAEPIAARALAAFRHLDGEPVSPAVSDRELETLSLLPSLLSLEEIAAELGISINTVKSHIRAIYAKLDVNTRRAAVVSAHRRRILPIRR